MVSKFAKETFYRPKAEEALAANNYFFALFANSLRVVSFLHGQGFGADQKLSWFLDIEPFRWSEAMAHHFSVSPGKGGKKGTSTQFRSTSSDEMINCLLEIQEHFLVGDDLASCYSYGREDDDNKRLAAQFIECFSAIRSILDARYDHSKAKLDGQHGQIFSNVGALLFPGKKHDEGKPKRQAAIDGIIQNLLLSFDIVHNLEIADQFKNNLFRLIKRLSGPVTAQSLYADTVFGPYYIIRKSRAGITSDPSDSELIVRDLLWLRPTTTLPDNEGISAPILSQPSDALGYYVSALDEQVYEVTHVSKRGEYILIDAIAFLDNNETKSLCLYTPKMPVFGTDKLAYGSIIGTLRDSERTGAWSTLIIRPEISEEECLRFHYVFSFFSDALNSERVQDREKDYDENIKELYWVYALKNICGVLFSKFWLSDAESECPKSAANFDIGQHDLRASRDSFNECFHYDGMHADTLLSYAISLVDRHERSGELDALSREILTSIVVDVLRIAEHTAITPMKLPSVDIGLDISERAVSRFGGFITSATGASISIPYSVHYQAYGHNKDH